MTSLSRRAMMGAAAAVAAAPRIAMAQTGPDDEIIDLWPSDPPGKTAATITRKITDQSRDPAHPDRWVTGVARPVMVVRRPERPNGSAVLVMPGGGYGFLSYDNEGTSQAAWLNARGVTAFILLYRLPAEGWHRHEDVPLQDAQRAMRLIRAGAQRFSIKPDRIGVIGFSAGGHLAGSLATRHGEQVYAPVDATDRLPARPDVAGLIYPVISLEAPFTHGGSRDMLLGDGASTEMRRARSVELRVDAATPPTFLVHAADDGLVPVANSIAMFQSLQAAKRPAAMHLFEDGGHGFGVRLPQTMQAAAWPRLFATFAARHGAFPETPA
ncbi:alpha/beta hydrolase [Sphingobium sp. H39-3-25]|uniref:alpha/beta hydrolase n=1 Tax=Sphingobium arseniciresistens TaxID=3030834 RepID=UPI0023B951A6|nr:alpha/beta hydrolase [Sphingobium arseniciresistens]